MPHMKGVLIRRFSSDAGNVEVGFWEIIIIYN